MVLTNHPTDELLRVTVDAGDKPGDNEKQQLNSDTEMMEITPDHPVYVEGKGWVWAENLAIGDKLRRADGGWAKVLAVERVKLDEPEVVYNFTVKGPHTYFVLEVGVLVHNCGGGDDPDITSWAPRGPNGPNHSKDLQRVFIAGLDDSNVMAVRPMDWGVWSWERLGVDIRFKPMAATETLFPNTSKFSEKTRRIAEQTAKRRGQNFADLSDAKRKELLAEVEPVRERLVRKLAGYRDTNAGILLADADVAWAIKFDELKGDHLLIDNEVFHNMNRVRMQEAFIALGHKNTPVLHGPHMNVELMLTVQGLDPDIYFGGHKLDFFQRYYKDTVYIYGRNYQGQTGYLGFGTMEQTLNTYAPNWRELTDGGSPVPEYGERYLPDGITSMKILEVLDHLERFRSFPKTLR